MKIGSHCIRSESARRTHNDIDIKVFSPFAPLSRQDELSLAGMLVECFGAIYEARIFYKQEPHVRVMAYAKDDLVGHAGLDYRTIRVGSILLSIVGVIDLCVCVLINGELG